MRIAGGIARGVVLDAPRGMETRPTAARAREALFSSLLSAGLLESATVVDLFAGTGALGLEAASRGASKVFLVERSRQRVDVAERNAAKVAKAGVSAETAVIRGDATRPARLMPGLKGEVDLILADPPYADTERHLSRILLDAEFAEWAGDATMVWEVPDEPACRAETHGSLWKTAERRRFGGADFLVFRPK